MTGRAIYDAYRAMGPRPGAEAKIWQQIDAALEGRAAERRIQLRPRRRSSMLLRTAAVLVLALGLLAAAGLLALPRLIGARAQELQTAAPAETAQPIPTLAPEDLRIEGPAFEPGETAETAAFRQILEQSYRYLALDMTGADAAEAMGLPRALAAYTGAAEGPDPLDALGYAYLERPDGSGPALLLAPLAGERGALAALYLERDGTAALWAPGEESAQLRLLESGQLLCLAPDGSCSLYGWAAGEPVLIQQLLFEGDGCSLLRQEADGATARSALSREEGETLRADLLARGETLETTSFRAYPEAERLERELAAALALDPDAPAADGHSHDWTLRCQSAAPADCQHRGVQIRICGLCGAEHILRYAGEHALDWSCDEYYHRRICSLCGQQTDEGLHYHSYLDLGWGHRDYCAACGYVYGEEEHDWSGGSFIEFCRCGAWRYAPP